MGLNEGSGECWEVKQGRGGGKSEDEWLLWGQLHRGILGNGHAEAFLLALNEKWRECDKSQMELTANWLDFL